MTTGIIFTYREIKENEKNLRLQKMLKISLVFIVFGLFYSTSSALYTTTYLPNGQVVYKDLDNI